MPPDQRHARPGPDQAIVVVSGLPRSGTSMMMRMLDKGGVAILSDGVRVADESNPRGYYEFTPVKALGKDRDVRWVDDARGKAVKVVSSLLEHLPDGYDYRVIFMRRDLDEVIASQNTMLARRGEPVTESAGLKATFERHLRRVLDLVARRPGFSVLEVDYTDALFHPREVAERVAAFVDRPLDRTEMALAVEEQLYRNRRPGATRA